jgi:trehalose synthase
VLQPVYVGSQSVAAHRSSAGADAVSLLRELAAPLRGLRVLHINATPYGGGVAEILRSQVPLLRDLGIAAEWKLITGDRRFFEVTKRIHNGMQGAAGALSDRDRDEYLAHSRRATGDGFDDYDVIVVHDPQPLPLRVLHGGSGGTPWVWRCHIDTSEPSAEVWALLRPFVEAYDAAVFTMSEFVPAGINVPRLAIIPPAIDPLSPKNTELGRRLAVRVLRWIGVDPGRPLITQVSRFDRWKDPLGVLAAHRIVLREVPDLQLALVGSMALDDPEGWRVYRELQHEARADPSVHLFTNLTGVGNIEVNAFQRLSDVVVQKSVREGFGLVVSEALWKATPVVAGRAGGIPLQMPDGTGGILVDSVEECAEALSSLLRDPGAASELGARGREVVRERFLITRLLADELRLYRALTGRADLPRG